LHEDAAIGAHRKTGADRLRRLRRSNGDHHDLGGLAGFLQAQGFLDRDFVERVHRHLDVGEFNARSIALDADLDVVIDHPLYWHKNLHRSSFARILKIWLAWARNLKVPLSAVNARKPKIAPDTATLPVLAGHPQHVSGAIIVRG